MRKVALLLLAAVPLLGQNASQPAAPTTTLQSQSTAQSASTAPWGLAALAPQPGDDATAKKAKQLLDKMIGALGGQAFLTWQTVAQHGRSYSFYQGQPNSVGVLFWRFYKYPDKDRVELTKQRDVIYVINGNEGYEITYKGTAEQEKETLEENLRRRDHSLEIVIREWLKDPKTMVIYGGTGTANQRMVENVTLLNSANDSVTISIDPNDMLPAKRSYTYRNPVYKVKDEEADVYANYRSVQGIMTPQTVSRMKNDLMTSQRFINEVEYNVVIDDAKFAAKTTYSPYKLSPKR